ncbi:MAG: CBS domain-containing protein [Deltaproteobacteria bacterium]|nr:CBS domain-containing protein [Deltaproteobacteria bacterium]
MPLSDILKGKVVSCKLDHTIKDAADHMKAEDVGAMLVVDEAGKPVGICTDRDIVLRCVCDGVSLDDKVSDIMTRTLATVKQSAGIQDVIRLMRDREIRRVPVVDESGKAVGLISFGDIVGLLAKELSDISTATPVDVAA